MDELEKLYNKLGENDKAFLSQGLDVFKAKIASNKDYQDDMIALAYSYGFDHNKIIGEVKKKGDTPSSVSGGQSLSPSATNNTPTSYLGGELGLQKPKQVVQPNVGLPIKPKGTNTFEESVGGMLGNVNVDNAQQYQSNDAEILANAKPNVQALPPPPKAKYFDKFNKPVQDNFYVEPIVHEEITKGTIRTKGQLPTSREMAVLGNKLMEEKDKSEFAQSNQIPQEQVDQAYSVELGKRNAVQQKIKQEKAKADELLGIKTKVINGNQIVSELNPEYYGLAKSKNENGVDFVKPNDLVSEDEQIAAAVVYSPIASKEFKYKFKENKSDLVDMYRYMDRSHKNDIKLKLQVGKYDQFEQHKDLSNYYNAKLKVDKEDYNTLKLRSKEIMQSGDIAAIEKLIPQAQEIETNTENYKKKNEELIKQFPDVANEQLKQLIQKEKYDKIGGVAKFSTDVMQGIAEGFKTVAFELPASLARIGVAATTNGDVEKIATWTLNDMSDKVSKFRAMPKQEGIHGFVEDVTKSLLEMYLVYGKVAPSIQKGLENTAGNFGKVVSKNSGLFSTSVIHQLNGEQVQLMQQYDLNANDAFRLGLLKSMATAGTEGYVNESKFFDWANPKFTESIIRRVIRGGEGFGDVVKEIGKNIRDENIEEFLGDVGSKVAQNMYSIVSNIPQLKEDIFDADGILNTIKITTATTLLATSPLLLQAKKGKGYYEGMIDLAENEELFTKSLQDAINYNSVTKEQAELLVSQVAATKQALTKLPSDMAFDSKAKIVPIILQKDKLTAQNNSLAEQIVANEQSGLDEVIVATKNKAIKEQIAANEELIKGYNKEISSTYESDQQSQQANQAAPSETNTSGDTNVTSENTSEGEAVGVPTESATEPIGGQENAPISALKVSDEEYKDFIDNGIVSEERIISIAEKVKNREKLTDRETEIFSDKTADVNKIIAAQPLDEEIDSSKPIPSEAFNDVESTTKALEDISEKDFDKLTPSQKIALYNEHGITKEDGSPITEKDIENNPLQYSYDFMASSDSGKWNSANSELESAVQGNRKQFSIYKLMNGEFDTFKEFVDFINSKNYGDKIEYTEKMKRADDMSPEERKAAVDSYNKSVEDKTGDKAQKEKDVLDEHGFTDEKEYSPQEIIDKFPLKGVQKVIWDIIKPIVDKLGIKVKFSSSRITEGFDGSNNPMNGEILIRPSTLKNGRLGEVLVHEVVHSLTTKIISRVNSGVETGLTGKQVAAVKGLNKLYKSIEADNNLQNKYPVKDIFEFIAHLTNDSFVKELESKDRNFIQKVVDFISDILGLSNANELAKKYLKDIIHDGTFLEKEGITVVSSDYAANVKGAEGLSPKQRLLEAIKNSSKNVADKYHSDKNSITSKAVESLLSKEQTPKPTNPKLQKAKEELEKAKAKKKAAESETTPLTDKGEVDLGKQLADKIEVKTEVVQPKADSVVGGDVYKNNSELSKIGTEQEYSDYIKSVFPNSKEKGVFYHSSPNKIEKFRDAMFGNYFSYSPIKGVYGNVIHNVLLDVKNALVKPKPTDSIEIKESYNKEYRNYNNPSSKYDASIEGSTVTEEGVQIRVKNPEQIHILGSKSDIEGFKKWKQEQSLKATPKTELTNGVQVELPSQMKGGLPRVMEYNDGKWKQKVGRELTEVGEKVQEQAQAEFEKNGAKVVEVKKNKLQVDISNVEAPIMPNKKKKDGTINKNYEKELAEYKIKKELYDQDVEALRQANEEVRDIFDRAAIENNNTQSEPITMSDSEDSNVPKQEISVSPLDTRPEANLMGKLRIKMSDWLTNVKVGLGMSDTLRTGERKVTELDANGKPEVKDIRDEGGIGYPFKSLNDLINGTLKVGEKIYGWAAVKAGAASAMINAAKAAEKITGKELKEHYYNSLPNLTPDEKARIEKAIPDSKQYGLVTIYKMGEDGIKSNEAFSKEAFRLMDVNLTDDEKIRVFEIIHGTNKVKGRLETIKWGDVKDEKTGISPKEKYLPLLLKAKNFTELEAILNSNSSDMSLGTKAEIMNKVFLSSDKTESSEKVNPLAKILKDNDISVDGIISTLSEPIMEGINAGQPMILLAIDPDSNIIEDVGRKRHPNYAFGVEGFPIGLYNETSQMHHLSPEMMDTFVKTATTTIDENVSVKGSKEKVRVSISHDSNGNYTAELGKGATKLQFTNKKGVFKKTDGKFYDEKGSSVKDSAEGLSLKSKDEVINQLKKQGYSVSDSSKVEYTQNISGSNTANLMQKAKVGIINFFKDPQITAQQKLVSWVNKSFPNIEIILDKEAYAEKDKNLKNQKLLNKNDKTFGVVDGETGNIYLNPEFLNNNTPIHEMGHVWNQYAKKYKPKLYKKGIDLITDTTKSRYFDNVINNLKYRKLAEQIHGEDSFIKNKKTGKYEINPLHPDFESIKESIADEALAKAIGDKGELFVNEAQKRNFVEFITELYNSMKGILGFDNISPNKFQNLTLQEFTNAVLKDLLSGKKVSNLSSVELAKLTNSAHKFSLESETDPNLVEAVRDLIVDNPELTLPELQAELDDYSPELSLAFDEASNIETKQVVPSLIKALNKSFLNIGTEILANSKALMDKVKELTQGKPSDLRYSIIGEKGASRLDNAERVLSDLNVAKQMEQAGKTPKEIHLATSWEKGVDGKWRFEVPDIELSKDIKKYFEKGMNPQAGAYLRFVIDAAELFKAYPSLNKVRFEFYDGEKRDAKGSWDKGTNTISVNRLQSEEEVRSTIIHEIQHAIQEQEGFAKGGNQQMFEKELEIFQKEYDEIYSKRESLNPTSKEFDIVDKRLNELSDILHNPNTTPFAKYKRLAGEVESRNAEKRATMTPEERKAKMLAETEDVAREQQIIIRDAIDGGVKYNITLPNGEKKQVQNVNSDVVNGFYSNTENALAQVKQEKMSGNQWATQLLSRGANKEEMKWTTLTDFLEANKDKSISKKDIQQYLKDNRISVVEVVKGKDSGEKMTQWRIIDNNGNAMGAGYDTKAEAEADVLDLFPNRNFSVQERDTAGIAGDISRPLASPTKFENYQLEGEKENYKEVLVTLPFKNKLFTKRDELRKKQIEAFNSENYELSNKIDNEIGEITKKLIEQKAIGTEKEFKSTHFDEPNILVHLRMNTRTDAQGNKVLFLEEVQSDFGQSYKKDADSLVDFINKNEEKVIEAYKKIGKLRVEC
jgi:hypothetical protein